MIPKKPNILYQQVAEDLNIPESLVDTFMTFYYKELRKNLSELNYSKVNIDGLGVMTVKPRTVEGLINKYTNRVEKLNTNTLTSYNYKKRVEDKIELLHKIKGIIDEEKKVKEEFLKEKADEKARKNLEK
jgi:hypothetical protein